METLKISRKKDYAIIHLDRGKVNAINFQMVEELYSTIQSFKSDSAVQGVIITGKPHFFSAGLDVIELYGYDAEKIQSFFKLFSDLHIELVQFPKPLISAITGHAPAGGTVIAMTSDFRVMANGDAYTLGLNEINVNVSLPAYLIKGYAFWLGEGRANTYLLNGTLMTANEAFAVGFFNMVCPLEEVLQKAEEKMQVYLKADDAIFRSIKYKSRRVWMDSLRTTNAEDLKESMEVWWRPEIRNKMKQLVEKLTTKKSS